MKKQTEIRKNALSRFGFGTSAMKGLVVCENCNSLESSGRTYCSKCDSKLPKTSLYSLYKSQHTCCSNCGTVLSVNMYYCPHCGIKVKEKYALCAL